MKTHRFPYSLGWFLVLTATLTTHAATSSSEQHSSLPVYELRMAAGDWSKLQQDPGSDERHPARFTAEGKEYAVTVRYRGDWARSWPKKPLKIFFEKDKDFHGQHALNLNSNWRDPSFVREQLAYHIYDVCGVPASATRMVKLNLNGRFYGVFLEVEQPDKPFLKRTQLKGAVLYKANSHSWQSDERDLGKESAFRAQYEKETHKNEDYSDLQRFCHELAGTKDVIKFFETRVDLDRYVNFLAASALVQNWDWFSKNHFLVHDAAGPKKWLTVPWDLDRTLGDHWRGRFDVTNVPLRLGTRERPATIGWNKVYDAFLHEPTLRNRLLDRLEVLLQTEFTKEKIFPVIDRWETELAADVNLDRQRWPSGRADDFHAGMEELKTYIEGRRAFLFAEIKRGRAAK